MMNNSIDVRKAAILRHVWTLSFKERKELTTYLLYKIAGHDLIGQLDERSYDYTGVLWHGNIPFEVSWIQCSKEYIYDHPQEMFLLSFRHIADTDVSLVLIKQPKDMGKDELAKVKEF